MSKKIMIVGGAGFVGAYLARDLADRGDKVVIFDIRKPSDELKFILHGSKNGIIFVYGSCVQLSDLIQTAREHQIENIVHLAALQDVVYANMHPLAAYEINLLGTINVLETARLLKLGRIVYGSTTGVYIPRQYDPMDEKHPMFSPVSGHPVGHYGGSKAAADIAALTYYSTNDVDVVGVRLSNVYGFGMWAHMYIRPAIENLVKGKPTHYELGSDALFDSTYVKDAARGTLLALDADGKKLKQRLFLIAQGKLNSGEDAAQAIREIEPDIDVQVGPGMTDMQAKFFRTTLDISKAREQLGYEPEFDLKSGIAEYISLQRAYAEYKASQ
ncbi:MAG: NAD-dependent epimerase/dehydratase family protein [Anaerolineales bacterium]|nr:NAD-dependent epimerase/dehydratase family protein [Anaerolineales bacterium]